MNKTVAYYNAHAKEYAASADAANMREVRGRFLNYLKPGQKILDAGCGSGRDALAFLEAGYETEAFDASEKLCGIASEKTGLEVWCQRFEELEGEAEYDGIWACASLLHVEREALPDVLRRLRKLLRPNGILYASFKLGSGTSIRDGRSFLDLSEEECRDCLKAAGFFIKEIFVTEDVRDDHTGECWVNAIAAIEGEIRRVDREPTRLVATKLYTTYQLCCSVFPTEGRTVHETFNKLVLYIIDWVRTRAGADEEAVEKLSPYPAPDYFAEFDLEEQSDIAFTEAFAVNTLYLPDERNWSLRISEPDNYAQYAGKDVSEIVQGRSFITNIAVREAAGHITLSYKCACKEPRTSTEDCEVFRPGFVKKICADADFSIREMPDTDPQLDRIEAHCIRVDSNYISNNLASGLILREDRQLPVLLFTGGFSLMNVPEDIAGSLTGFAHVFAVDEKQFTRLFKARLQNNEVKPGDVVLYRKGGDYEILEIGDSDNPREVIVPYVRLYPVRKNIDYRDTLFYREAREARINSAADTEDPKELREQIRAHQETIENQKVKIGQMAADVEVLEDLLREADKDLSRAERTSEDLREKLERVQADNEVLAERGGFFKKEGDTYRTLLKAVMNFPTRKEDVPGWVRANFGGQLILLKSAEDDLRKYNKPLNLKTLCSGLLYLNAYMLYKRGEITKEERDFYQLEKSWSIEKCGDRNIRSFSEYKVNLAELGLGKRTAYLDYHIKSGVKAEALVRIYFLMDEELDRIVIGHLPDHLRVLTYSH